MNRAHLEFLASPDWKRMLEADLVPWMDGSGDLGDDVLEVGAGPGLTTDLLRERCARVTAVELDDDLAAALADRLAGTNVEVIHGDATATGLPDDRFSAAACLSMLHHVPSPELQDQIFAELARVLRSGGVLVAVDAVDHEVLREFHEDDTFQPLDPVTLPDRLVEAGFGEVELEVGEYELRLRARKA